MTLPDVLDLTLDRLVLCAANIAGINQVTRFEPPVKRNDKFPMLFFEAGGLLNPLSAPVSQAANTHLWISRSYNVKLLIRPISEAQQSSTDGTQEDEEVRPFIALIENYFAIQHRFLGTTALSQLVASDQYNWSLKVAEPVQISDSGIRDVPDRFTADLYLGCVFTLTVSMQLIVNPTLIGA